MQKIHKYEKLRAEASCLWKEMRANIKGIRSAYPQVIYFLMAWDMQVKQDLCYTAIRWNCDRNQMHYIESVITEKGTHLVKLAITD